ncbi:DNA-directed RNA polymerase subunit beta'' [Folsomia candida]|uniref:DNA-directed RNA polymerase subunit beta n=1 Tax=Folsomia candida TaxID=158441 RepID=A0A226D7N7_FOLCA|nr:DNA-directed RNA polymerase subunit beta'' [Folsomia candida]
MFISIMHRVYGPVVLLWVILYPVCFSLKDNSDVAIPKKIVQHVENCDLQILHDVDLSSDYFSFLQDALLARTIIFMPQFEKRVHNFTNIRDLSFTIDVMITRPAGNKITDDGKILASYERLTPQQEIWVGSYNPSNMKEDDFIEIKKLPHPSLNPFDGKTYISMPLYMAAIVVESGRNATLVLKRWWDHGPFVVANMEVETNLYVRNDEGMLSEYTYSTGYQFLSCYADSYITFDFYVTPFHPAVWLALISSLLLTFMRFGIGCCFVNKLLYGNNDNRTERTVDTITPEKFQDLICRDRHILNSKDYQDVEGWAKDAHLNSYFEMLSTPAQTTFGTTYVWYTHLAAKYFYDIINLLKEFQFNKKSFIEISKAELFYLLLLNPVHNFLPSYINFTKSSYTTTELQDLVERDVTICQKKTVLVGMLALIEGEMDFLTKSYPSKKFYSGSDLLEQKWSGWSFLGGGRSPVSRSISPVHQRFKALVHSGIYSRLKREMARNMWKQRRPVANDTSDIVSFMGMNGRLVTIFMICGALFSVAMIVFLAEVCNYAWKFVYLNVYQRFYSCRGKL